MRFILLASLLDSFLCNAASAPLGVKFDKRDALPLLTLPYATYRASNYDPNGDIYTFKNIRFAAPPVGNLRWARPSPPEKELEVQNGSYGPICKQAPSIGASVPTLTATDEDCLFLDLYVPGKAVQNPSPNLPVISWFYGGAYQFGGKDQSGDLLPLYNGTGLIQQSGGNVIFVSSNYRLGAYGFLAGSTMEKEGLPNAGFYDQRAALQWIQDYVGLVGGNKSQVSAWGESAGAGSILYHLIAFGGKQEPLFSKAVLQSPAFKLKFDRKGLLEDVFQNFTSLVGCGGQGVACLRAASAEALDSANVKLNQDAPTGTFLFGPSADGSWVRQLPALELDSGNFHQIDSIILSHVFNEAETFIPSNFTTDSQSSTILNTDFPPYAQAAGVAAAIESRYPRVMNNSSSPYLTERDRLRDIIGDREFYCNVRFLTNAYTGKSYNLQYSVTPGLHATDVLPTFYNTNLNLTMLGQNVPFPLIPGFGSFAQAYQSYLTSHARSGNPNTFRETINVPPTIPWPKPDNSQDLLDGVLNAGDLGFSIIRDDKTGKDKCKFWRDIAATLTLAGGYAP